VSDIAEKLDRLETGLAVIGERIDRLAAMFDEVRGITERAQQRDMELQACLAVERAREEAIEERMAEVGTAVVLTTGEKQKLVRNALGLQMEKSLQGLIPRGAIYFPKNDRPGALAAGAEGIR
jgi:small-conductance mechanosensitive channel